MSLCSQLRCLTCLPGTLSDRIVSCGAVNRPYAGIVILRVGMGSILISSVGNTY